MKVLHICAIGDTVAALLIPQIDYLIAHGISVEIACSPGKQVDLLKQKGYIIHPIQIDRKISFFSSLRSIYQLAKCIHYNAYDLVHVHTPIAAVLGRIASKLVGVKIIIYTTHGFPFHDLSSKREYLFYSMIERMMAKLTDLIISQNHEDIATSINLGICQPAKIKYLGNGVDIDRFNLVNLDPTSQVKLLKSLGICNTKKLFIGTIGRLTSKKGSRYLIEATAKLLPDFPDLQILIIGGQLNSDREPFYSEILNLISTYDLEEHITLTGSRKDIPNLLGLLDIFTLPTYSPEGLPRSILEAMAMCLPIVTTDIRGCREAVIHKENGLIVPPRNSDKLASALKLLLADKSLRQIYGHASRCRVEKEYDERFVFNKLEKYYAELGAQIF